VSDDAALYAYTEQLKEFSPTYAERVEKKMGEIAANPDLLKQALVCADQFEAAIRKLGTNGDGFDQDSRARWKQHSLKAFLGLSPDFSSDSKRLADFRPWWPKFPGSTPSS
jgi:hypothetical protein